MNITNIYKLHKLKIIDKIY